MKALAILLFATVLVGALLSAHQHKPFETLIDAQSPGVWPKYAAANRVEMVDQYACMRLVVPYQVTDERRKGVTRT